MKRDVYKSRESRAINSRKREQRRVDIAYFKIFLSSIDSGAVKFSAVSIDSIKRFNS